MQPKGLSVRLDGTPAQFARLRALQAAFAEVCNAIGPVVQSTRCWNRVALHHLVYHPMRERFPALGSQMICNAIYSVSRAARVVYQDPKSPWNVGTRGDAPLPLLRFGPTAPVYFDRHTLSLKGSMLSMFTLDGRMRFDLRLAPADIARFHDEKLIEVMLTPKNDRFQLSFRFASPNAGEEPKTLAGEGNLPTYVVVVPPDTPLPTPPAPPRPEDTGGLAAR